MMLQLNPTIPVTCPKGAGQALLVIDYGSEHNLFWVIALDDSGELWTYANPEVRAQKNITMGRSLGEVKKDITFVGATLREGQSILDSILSGTPHIVNGQGLSFDQIFIAIDQQNIDDLKARRKSWGMACYIYKEIRYEENYFRLVNPLTPDIIEYNVSFEDYKAKDWEVFV